MTKRNHILDLADFSTWNLDSTELVQKLYLRGLREIINEAAQQNCYINWLDDDDEYIHIHLPIGRSEDWEVRWRVNIREYLLTFELDDYQFSDGTFAPEDAERFAKIASKLRKLAEGFETAAKKARKE